MQLTQNIRATAVKGSLEVTLDDGRIAALDIDLDLSSPLSSYGVEHEYAERDGRDLFTLKPAVPLGTTYSVFVPSSIHRQDESEFTLRIPIGDTE